MAISKDKTRIILTILKENKDKLDKVCEQEKRTLSNQVEIILEDYFKRNNID